MGSIPGPGVPGGPRHGAGKDARGGGEAGRGDSLRPAEKAGELLDCCRTPFGESVPLQKILL